MEATGLLYAHEEARLVCELGALVCVSLNAIDLTVRANDPHVNPG
jgi:hypothetical protein